MAPQMGVEQVAVAGIARSAFGLLSPQRFSALLSHRPGGYLLAGEASLAQVAEKGALLVCPSG